MIDRREPGPSLTARFRALRRVGSLTYSDFTDVFADLFGDRTVFHLDRDLAFAGFDPRRVSYRDLHRGVARIGRVLSDLGVAPGDRVGVMALNRVEAVFCNFGVARIGAVPIPMNFMLRPPECQYVLDNAGADVLIVDSTTLEQNFRGDLSQVPAARTVVIMDTDEVPPGAVGLPGRVAAADESMPAHHRGDPAEVATIFYTSGTTGRPKGAALSDSATTVSLRRMGRVSALGLSPPRQLALLVMPVAHSGGYQNMLMYIALGVPMQFVSRFSAVGILDTIETDRPTFFVGSPAMYRMLEDAGAASRDLSSIWLWGGGSDAFDAALVARFRRYARKRVLGGRVPVNAFFVRGYGMTEANSYVAVTPPFEVAEANEGETCIGWTLPGVSARVADPETGEPVGRGEVGELWLRGVSMMSQYWADPERSSEALVDGWYRTGDWVRRGKWGLLFFVDRAKDVIKTGGYKVGSAEIETVLHEHPDVEHAAAVGVAHATKGQIPVAAVTLVDGALATAEEILEWARERLAPYKAPRRVHVLEHMPLTFSLKPKKEDVRRMIEDEDGAAPST